MVRGPVWIFSKNAAEGLASIHALARRLDAEHLDVAALAFAHSGPIVGGCIQALAGAQ